VNDQPGDEYEALFRPDAPATEPPEVKTDSAGPVETGRVFKSQGVQGNEDGIACPAHESNDKVAKS